MTLCFIYIRVQDGKSVPLMKIKLEMVVKGLINLLEDIQMSIIVNHIKYINMNIVSKRHSIVF